MKRAFTLIELMIVIAIIAIIAAIAIPNLIEARKSANESSAIGAIRTIISAQAIYVQRSESLTYGDLLNLRSANLIDEVLANGTKSGYRISSRQNNINPSFSFTAAAEPLTPNSGNRRFFVDQSGVIRYCTTGVASVTSPVLGGAK